MALLEHNFGQVIKSTVSQEEMRQHILQGEQLLSSAPLRGWQGGTLNACKVPWHPHISYGILSEEMLENIGVTRKKKNKQTVVQMPGNVEGSVARVFR